MSEAGAFTRYFGRLLIFLGLLGTFWGLLQVVSDVGEAVRAVTESSTGAEADVLRLMSAIEDPIQGMGTAFASSLFGLAGSLVIGFLDLQASRAESLLQRDRGMAVVDLAPGGCRSGRGRRWRGLLGLCRRPSGADG